VRFDKIDEWLFVSSHLYLNWADGPVRHERSLLWQTADCSRPAFRELAFYRANTSNICQAKILVLSGFGLVLDRRSLWMAPDRPATNARRLWIAAEAAMTGAAKGYRGSIEGRTLVPEQETSISELVGRAWDDTRRRVPDLTVFTDAQDLVVGFATPGYPCDDVRCAQPRITSNYTGRERFARDDTIDTLRAYGIFFWVPIGPANLPKTLSGSNSPCAIQAALLVPPLASRRRGPSRKRRPASS
jgi:hypothetical protein